MCQCAVTYVWRIASRAIRGAVGCSHRVRRDAVRTITPFRVPLSARSSRLSITDTLFTPQPSRHTQPTPPHAHPTSPPGQLHRCLVSSTGPAAPGPPLPARFFWYTPLSTLLPAHPSRPDISSTPLPDNSRPTLRLPSLSLPARHSLHNPPNPPLFTRSF